MIPKIIHYCWFGKNPLPDSTIKCIESWKKYCPDYQIIEWNENNFNVNIHPFTKEAYGEKKYAFVTDYVRLYIVYNHGGIYFDTDVELIKNIDELLVNDAFIGAESFGSLINPGSGLGAIKHFKIISEFLDVYKDMHFINEDRVLNMTPITCLLKPVLIKKGWKIDNTKQIIAGMTIYSTEYFCPKDYDGVMKITKNTYSIHHFTGFWVDGKMKADSKKQKKLAQIIGTTASVYVWYLVKIYKRNGLLFLLKRFPHLINRFLSMHFKKIS